MNATSKRATATNLNKNLIGSLLLLNVFHASAFQHTTEDVDILRYEELTKHKITIPCENCTSCTCIRCNKPHIQLHLNTIPVPCNNKQYHLFLIVPPFHGSTALEGLLSSSKSLSTMCGGERHVPRCEGQTILARAELLTSKNRWQENIPTNWIDALKEYEKYWDNEKRVLMDKSPPNVVKVKHIAQQLRAASYEPVFIFMTRSPCFMSVSFHSKDKWGEGETADYEFLTIMMENYQYLIENRFPVMHIRYEDMLQNPEATAKRITEWMPCLGELDPANPHIRATGDRGLSLSEYAATHKLTAVFPHVSKKLFPAFHFFGYV